MEGISQTANSIAGAAHAVSQSISETTSNTLQSIPTPTPKGVESKPVSEFSSFKPFDPSVFEKAPKEFGHTDPFKDTNIVARTQFPHIQAERFDFVDFNFLFSVQHTPEQLPSTQVEGAENDPEYDFQFAKLPSVPEPPTYNIQIGSKGSSQDFEEFSFEDIETKHTTDEELSETVLTQPDIAVQIHSEEDENTEQATQIKSTSTNIDGDENEDEDEDKDPEGIVRKGLSENTQQEGHPDAIKTIMPKFVVDFEANKARIQDAEISIKSISPTTEGISGEQIADLMNQTPSFEETSEVLTIIPTYKDGSYAEILEDISKQTFSDKSSALIKIIEIIRKKPAVMMAQVGKAVNEFDVERVFKFMQHLKSSTAIHPISA